MWSTSEKSLLQKDIKRREIQVITMGNKLLDKKGGGHI